MESKGKPMIRTLLTSYADRKEAEAARLALINPDHYRIMSYRDPLTQELRYAVIRKPFWEK